MNRSFMELIGARKKVILLCTLAGLLIGVVIEIVTPKVYVAKVTVVVMPSGPILGCGGRRPARTEEPSVFKQASHSVNRWLLDQKKSMGF